MADTYHELPPGVTNNEENLGAEVDKETSDLDRILMEAREGHLTPETLNIFDESFATTPNISVEIEMSPEQIGRMREKLTQFFSDKKNLDVFKRIALTLYGTKAKTDPDSDAAKKLLRFALFVDIFGRDKDILNRFEIIKEKRTEGMVEITDPQIAAGFRVEIGTKVMCTHIEPPKYIFKG